MTAPDLRFSGPDLSGMPDARSLVVDATASAGHPSVYGVVGVAGSGTSAVLSAITAAAGAQNPARVVRGLPVDPDPGAIVVADDIHLLDDAALTHLSTLLAREDISVFLAGRHHDHRRSLHDVLTTVSSRGRVVFLAPLTVAGVVERSRRRLLTGAAAAVVRASGGNRAAVDAGLTAVSAHPDEADQQVLADLAIAAIGAWHHQTLRRLDRLVLRTLAIAGAGSTLDPDTVGAICDVDDARAQALIDEARSSGFLGGSDGFLAAALAPLGAVVGAHQITAVREAVVRIRLSHNSLTVDGAVSAAQAGISDPGLAAVLVDAARAAAGHRRMTLWSAARAAGADHSVTDAELARAAIDADDLAVAARVADESLASADTAVVALGVRVGAAVAARRGTYSRAAQLFRWLGADRAGPHAAAGVVALLGAGDRTNAAEFLTVARAAPPTTDNAAEALLADGVVESLGPSAAPAVGALLRSLSLRGDLGIGVEDAADLAVLLHLHSGDLAGARAVVERVELDQSTPSVRLRLLDAWISMLSGELSESADALAALTPVHHRDRLTAHALTAALARRRGDAGTLGVAWRAAQTTVAEAEVDLFSLLPLGELWLAAVRVGDAGRIRHLADDAGRLLAALGEPPVWSAAWQWYGVQAAILADQPAALAPHGRALGIAADSTPYAAVLARAGRVWLRVLQGVAADGGPVTEGEIHTAATELQTWGHAFDGARLAAEGAMRIGDTRAATALLQTARSIGTATPSADGAPGTTALSDREAEVADRLVLGETYREIGAALYISAKTVEHHVARIRRRLGAQSRSELLSMLRAAGHGQTE
ncbi:LuxR C-terminal-related transcriptional regulator [Williamsia deligens]|uniref:LuxR C-terminal-related transcriptional regulator n=1 Tax=Williamsia deligens TaxID=321325 RepID=A0ABW3G3H9_9NOCA|nr:LuxR C-terminal-related transcriptional regulator [Williamsia deligens]MCP2194205.1 DNA-binding transcriptional regulator, CsgD family [Williamsia deligens]